MVSPSRVDVHENTGAEEEDQEPNVEEEKQEPNSGLAVAALFAILGAALWIAPDYVGFSGWLQGACYVAGGVSIALSFCGTFLELEEITDSTAYGWWGVGGFFLVLGVLLHMATSVFALAVVLDMLVRSIALLMAVIGGPMFFLGILSAFNEARQSSLRRFDTEKILKAIGSILLSIAPIIGKVLLNMLLGS